jgi:hypothetical protein
LHFWPQVFGGTGILPGRGHRLKTCATNIYHALWGEPKAQEELFLFSLNIALFPPADRRRMDGF